MGGKFWGFLLLVLISFWAFPSLWIRGHKQKERVSYPGTFVMYVVCSPPLTFWWFVCISQWLWAAQQNYLCVQRGCVFSKTSRRSRKTVGKSGPLLMLLLISWTQTETFWSMSFLDRFPRSARMTKVRKSYFGHIGRRQDGLERTVMFGKVEGNRRRGRPNGRWSDSVNEATAWSLQKLTGAVEEKMFHSSGHQKKSEVKQVQ